MKIRTTTLAALGLVLAAAGAWANPQEAMNKAGCLACHAPDKKLVGPSFKDIAAKYKGKAGAEATIVGNLKAAKGHPAVKTSDADTTKLVKWILAM